MCGCVEVSVCVWVCGCNAHRLHEWCCGLFACLPCREQAFHYKVVVGGNRTLISYGDVGDGAVASLAPLTDNKIKVSPMTDMLICYPSHG